MYATPKLLCVSLNPAIDRRITLPHFHIGEVNRARVVDPAAGGKAAHVAFAAKALGAEVRWLAFLGGAEGEACRSGVEAAGVSPIAVHIQSRTRTNLELIDESSREITEVLEPGPAIQASEQEVFLQQFARELETNPTVVLSGSLPAGVPSNFYAELVYRAKAAKCTVLLDTSGDPLSAALTAGPDLIKPNRQEASALLDLQIRTRTDASSAANALQRRGPRIVILSLGAEGAVAACEHGAWHGIPPSVKAISTVGSGDSSLAGWAVAFAHGGEPEECLRLAIACGTANCLAPSPGKISKSEVDRLLPLVEIEKIAL